MEIYTKGILGEGLLVTLRNPSGCLVLSHLDNTAYVANFVRPNFDYAETSYIPRRLYAIPFVLHSFLGGERKYINSI